MASFAKSGSTWLANMLADLPGFVRYQPVGWTASLREHPHEDIYPGMFEEARRRLAVIKGHTHGTAHNAGQLHANNRRYLLTVRDPRDQLISDYWYIRNHPLHLSHALAMSLDLHAFISHELDPTGAGTKRTDWITGWIINRDDRLSLLVRYEDLLVNTHGELERILDFLRFQVHESTVRKIIAKNSFDRNSGRARGTEDTRSFLRRGVSGEWKETFTDDHKLLFASQMEDLVRALGYEPTIPSQRR